MFNFTLIKDKHIWRERLSYAVLNIVGHGLGNPVFQVVKLADTEEQEYTWQWGWVSPISYFGSIAKIVGYVRSVGFADCAQTDLVLFNL